MRWIVGIIAVLAVAGVAAWFAISRPQVKVGAEVPNTTSATASSVGLPATAVLSINVARPSPVASTARRPAINPLLQEFSTAANLRALYDKLAGDMTPEGKYFRYRVLAACASRRDASSPMPRQKETAERRKRLADSISDANPNKQKRLAEFDSLSTRCEGLENLVTDSAELEAMLKDAVRAGYPAAIAEDVAMEINNSAKPKPGDKPPFNGPSLSDAQLEALKAAITSKNPDAIVTAGTALSNSFTDVVVEIGNDQIDGRASREAWRLVACEFGMACGPESRDLHRACAYEGHCDALSVPDEIFFYGATPAQSQLIESYRQAFRQAIESGNWSAIQFSRRPNNSPNRVLFGVGR